MATPKNPQTNDPIHPGGKTWEDRKALGEAILEQLKAEEQRRIDAGLVPAGNADNSKDASPAVRASMARLHRSISLLNTAKGGQER